MTPSPARRPRFGLATGIHRVKACWIVAKSVEKFVSSATVEILTVKNILMSATLFVSDVASIEAVLAGLESRLGRRGVDPCPRHRPPRFEFGLARIDDDYLVRHPLSDTAGRNARGRAAAIPAARPEAPSPRLKLSALGGRGNPCPLAKPNCGIRRADQSGCLLAGANFGPVCDGLIRETTSRR